MTKKKVLFLENQRIKINQEKINKIAQNFTITNTKVSNKLSPEERPSEYLTLKKLPLFDLLTVRPKGRKIPAVDKTMFNLMVGHPTARQ